MSTVKCSECNINESITFCSETSMPLCATCAIPCEVCNTPIALKRAQVTSTGRRLCAKCMSQRGARRKAKREKMKQRSEAVKQREAAPPSPQQPMREPKTVGGAAGLGPTSFEDLYSGNDLDSAPAQAPTPAPRQPAQAQQPAGGGATSFEDLHSGSDLDAAPLGPAFGESDKGLDEDGRPKKGFGLEGVPTDTGSRLELPPMDEDRPVLTSSGYKNPSKTAYAFAFIFFGVAGVIFYSATPILGDIMFPYNTPEFKFDAGQMPTIQEDNRLRNTSNLSQFDLFSQTPIFFVTWLLLIIYLGGCARIIYSVGYSAISSFRAKRRLRKIEKKYGGKDPFSDLS